MEREHIPVISTQVSIIALLYLGHLWIVGKIPVLFNDKYYLSLGAVLIIVGPVISQIIYGIWKIFWGFKSYDVTKYLCEGLPVGKARKVQIIFDNFWHNNINVNDKIIDYSRRRSVVCQMNLFASRILGFGALSYLITVFLNSTNNCDSSVRIGLLLFVISGLLTLLFDKNYKINSDELIEIEAKNIKSKRITNNNGYKEFKDGYFDITGKDLESILKNKL